MFEGTLKDIGFNDQEAPLDVSLNILWGFKIYKNMNEIIKITESNGQRLVSAKELYQFLSIDDGSNFSKWARTNIEEMFSHNVDYQNLRVTYENGGRPAADYALTIDCAKQVAMMSRCEKGRIAREYFIAMEKIAQQSMIQLPDFNNPAIAARAWADQYERRELAESKVKELSPKAEVFDRISNTDNLLTMNEAAKSLGISRPKLFAVLRGRNVLMANNLPYQLFIDKKLFKVKDKVIQMGDRSMVYPQTFVTGKGVAWIGKGLIKLEKE